MDPLIAVDDAFTPVIRELMPANIVIKVESFSSLSHFGVFESRGFSAGHLEWKLTMYPDGVHGDNEHVPVYLSIIGEEFLPLHWEANAAFTFFLYNHKLNNYLCFRGKVWCFNTKSRNYGFSKLISKKVLTHPSSGYLVDDCCLFGAEVSIIRSRLGYFPSNIQDPCNCDWVISRFSTLGDVWTSEIFCNGSHQWRVKLYPKGNGREKGRCVSIYLECISCRSFGPGHEPTTEFSITLKSHHSDSAMPSRSAKCSHRFTFREREIGLVDFISIDEFHAPSSGFLVEDNCYLGVTISN